MKLKHFLIYLFAILLSLSVYSFIKTKSVSNKSVSIPIIATSDSSSTSTPSAKIKSVEDSIFTVLAVGDIMMGRSVNAKLQKTKDFLLPAREISFLFKDADIVIANLESPFFDPCPQTDTGMRFCADPKSIETLKSLRVTHANLANNHIENYGQEGIQQTIETLGQNNITPIGTTNRSTTPVNIKGTTVSILGFNDVPPYPKNIEKLTEQNLKEKIASVSADFVIVTVHWGNEYQKASTRQKEFAHLAIDSGADLVIGHHPHWVQEIEEYKGKIIYYSLGNFIFDQLWSKETKEGLIAKVTIKNGEISSHSAIPILINNSYQPIPK